MNNKERDFIEFMSRFPVLDLPVTLNELSQEKFNRQNPPITSKWLLEFLPENIKIIDEFTEFTPCFRIPESGFFIGVVYWRASLFDQEFTIALYDKEGNILDSKSIGKTIYKKNVKTTTITTIDSDLYIYSLTKEELIDNSIVLKMDKPNVENWKVEASGNIIPF